jgi:hypothetical protein
MGIMITDIAIGLGGLLLKVFVIIMPLMVALEWVRTRHWFGGFIRNGENVFRPFGFLPPAMLSLITGLAFGIAYGAGVLISQSRSGELEARQIVLVSAFLGICHAIVEDTLLFAVIGGSAWIMVTARLLTALVVTLVLARLTRGPLVQPSGAVR